MKLAKKIALWCFGTIGALVLAFVALHTFYRLTPAALSEDAKALLAETAHMAQLTDNGYRMIGLLAPVGMDSAAYGRCYVNAWRAYVQNSPPTLTTADQRKDDGSESYRKRIDQAIATCAQDKPLLKDLPQPTKEFLVKPGVDWAKFAELSRRMPAPIYFQRWEEVLSGGRRGNDPDPFNAPFAPYTPPVALERYRLASFARAWTEARTEDEQLAAFAIIEPYPERLAQFADGTVLEAVIGAAAVTNHLVIMQMAAAQRSSLSDAIAARMEAATRPAAALPKAVANAIGAEVRFAEYVGNEIKKSGGGAMHSNAATRWLSRFGFDDNDTMNLMAMGYRESQQRALETNPPPFEQSQIYQYLSKAGCPRLGGEWSLICLPFERNPTGRAAAMIAMPAYGDYGARAHDVRNLAAATRLTVEARRRGLQGEALAQFVASAPEGMRDVYTQKPFAYDIANKKLTIELRTKSTVLGDKSYQLTL